MLLSEDGSPDRKVWIDLRLKEQAVVIAGLVYEVPQRTAGSTG